MTSFKRFCVALLLSVCALMSCSLSSPRAIKTASAGGLLPEVRIRKLHLVRPDLIPYPIEYDVYC